MNESNEPQKTLGQIAYETWNRSVGWSCRDWSNPEYKGQPHWEAAASAVEATVLSRLGGEWMLLSEDEIHQQGDEVFTSDGLWEKVLPSYYGKEVGVGEPCRRRIQPSPTPEVHVATEGGEWVPRSEREPREVDGLVMQFGTGNSKMITPPKVLWHGPTYAMEAPWDSPPSDSTHWKSLAPLPQPPATPSGEPTTFWEDKCKYLEGVRDRLTEQLQQVTRERDEAKEKYTAQIQLSVKYKNAAESAEKRLSEVERELATTKDCLLQQQNANIDLSKQLSCYRWIPASERLPTEVDAGKDGLVHWGWAHDGSINRGSWNYFAWSEPATHWFSMPPLPTPPEEDAFEKWAEKNDCLHQGQVTIVARKAFLAGQQSTQD